MVSVLIKVDKAIEADFNYCAFLAKNLDIADTILGNPFSAVKISEGRYRGGRLGFKARFELTADDLDYAKKKGTIRYFVDMDLPLFFGSLQTILIAEGSEIAKGKTLVRASVNLEGRGLTGLFLKLWTFRLDRLGESFAESFAQAAMTVAANPQATLETLHGDQRARLKEHLEKQELTPAKPQVSTILRINAVGEKSIVTFQTPVPKPKKVTDIVKPSSRAELENSFSDLARLCSYFGTSRGRKKESGISPRNVHERMRELGQSLYSIYIRHDVHAFLTSALEYGDKVHIKIDATGEDAALPWELLHNGQDFLALRVPISRTPMDIAYAKAISKIEKVLVVAPDPFADLPETVQEAEMIYDMLRKLKLEVKLLVGADASKDNFLRELKAGVQAVHYSGHSLHDDQSPGASRLIMQNQREIRADELRLLIQEEAIALQFVFLNSCYSAQNRHMRLDTASLCDAFVSNGVPCVLGMRWEISDTGASIFSAEFYQALGKLEDPCEALRKARLTTGVKLDWKDPAWASPVMYMS